MDLTMRVELLQAPYIISNFVKGESNCNYEIYLLELLNVSKYFSKEHQGVFYKPNSESNGECDAQNENYSIDFKLFASQTAFRARSLLSSQIERLPNGVTIYSKSRESKNMEATKLYAAFRRKTYEELCKIRQSNGIKYGIENDMINVLKIMETKKNLLLFFPYKFTFDNPYDDKTAVQKISEGLTEDFHTLFEYRNKQTEKSYDTYLTCIYNNSFIIFRFDCKDSSLHFCEMVKTCKVPTFEKLTEYNI